MVSLCVSTGDSPGDIVGTGFMAVAKRELTQPQRIQLTWPGGAFVTQKGAVLHQSFPAFPASLTSLEGDEEGEGGEDTANSSGNEVTPKTCPSKQCKGLSTIRIVSHCFVWQIRIVCH